MKLLLTSGGVTNPSILRALEAMLPKPISESTALCIPTAMYGHPMAGPGERVWEFVAGRGQNPMTELGWKSVGLIELTALPSIQRDKWVPLVEQADALLVSGGDVLYLHHWMRESGLTAMLPSLTDTVWVGLSAGSMVMAPRPGKEFCQWQPPDGSDTTLGLVDFAMCPHLEHDDVPGNSMAEAEEWAAEIEGPAYALDDRTAISVVDGHVEVVSEGLWRLIHS